MKAANPFRLAMSPLTRTVYAGRVRQREGYAEPTGPRHDVTSDFYGVLIQLADSHKGKFIINIDGQPAYEVTVRDAQAASAAEVQG